MQLAAIAGRIPSTAEPGADRSMAFDAVASAAADSCHPAGGCSCCRTTASGWKPRWTRQPIPTATSVIAAMVRFALALDPYLDRLDAASAGPSGRLNNCPG